MCNKIVTLLGRIRRSCNIFALQMPPPLYPGCQRLFRLFMLFKACPRSFFSFFAARAFGRTTREKSLVLRSLVLERECAVEMLRKGYSGSILCRQTERQSERHTIAKEKYGKKIHSRTAGKNEKARGCRRASSFQSFSVGAIEPIRFNDVTSVERKTTERNTDIYMKESNYKPDFVIFNQIIQVRRHEWLYNLRIVL